MSNTQYKMKLLRGLELAYPAIGGLAANTLMRWEPFAAAARAQDTIPASSRRVVADWSISGAIDWAQPNGSAIPNPASGHVYPYPVWRRAGTYHAMVTPGCELRARVFFLPSGLVQKDNVPVVDESDGAWAKVRIGTIWTNGGTSTGPHYRECSLPGSTQGTYGGFEETAPGANWAEEDYRDIVDIRPPTFLSDPAIGSKYSEWSSVEIRIEFMGGARITQVVVYEVPLVHVQAHNASDTSVHAMPGGGSPLTPMPQDDAADGVTYQENRFSTTQMRRVADRQSERLGPRILHWSSWDESTISVLTDTENDPVTFTLNAFRDLLGDTTLSTYAQDNPGWIVAAAHAKLHRLCEPRLIMPGGVAAVVPVRVRVDASRSAGDGIVRVQSGPYEWVDVNITGGRGWYTMVGRLETQVTPDHSWANLQVFARVASGTLSVWNICVDFGAWDID